MSDAKPAWASLGATELAKAIDEKRRELGDIFRDRAVHEIPAEEAKRVKPLNDELTDMAERYEAIRDLDAVKSAIDEQASKWAADNDEVIVQPRTATKTVKDSAPRSIGEAFVKSLAFKSFAERQQMNVPVELPQDLLFKAVLGTDATLAGVDDEYAPQAIRLPGIITPYEQANVVASLFPQATTTQNAIPFMVETQTTNAAAETAEAAAKPESALDFDESSAPVRKIATWLPVTEELFMDVPAMQGYVDARLRTFLLQREDGQLLTGDGVAPNLEGILSNGDIQTQALGADTVLDAVHKAVTKVRTVGFQEPDAVLFHPNDWEAIRLLKTATEGIYLWGHPSEPGPSRVWGIPVTLTTRLTENTGLVGAFAMSAMIFRRAGVTVRVADQHSDFAIYNKMAIIAEERIAFPIFRPTGFCTVTGI